MDRALGRRPRLFTTGEACARTRLVLRTVNDHVRRGTLRPAVPGSGVKGSGHLWSAAQVIALGYVYELLREARRTGHYLGPPAVKAIVDDVEGQLDDAFFVQAAADEVELDRRRSWDSGAAEPEHPNPYVAEALAAAGAARLLNPTLWDRPDVQLRLGELFWHVLQRFRPPRDPAAAAELTAWLRAHLRQGAGPTT
jgi:hypothetical protein